MAENYRKPFSLLEEDQDPLIEPGWGGLITPTDIDKKDRFNIGDLPITDDVSDLALIEEEPDLPEPEKDLSLSEISVQNQRAWLRRFLRLDADQEPLVSPGFATDIARIPFKAIVGTGQLITDVGSSIFDKVLSSDDKKPVTLHNLIHKEDPDDEGSIVYENENSSRRQLWGSFMQWWSESEYDVYAKTFGAQILKDGKQIPAISENLTKEQRADIGKALYDPITARPLPTETLPGLAVDLATMVAQGVGYARMLPQQMSLWKKFLIADIGVSQAQNPDFNIANVVESLDPEDKESFVGILANNPIVDFLAADKADSAMMQRVKLFLGDLMLVGGIAGAFKAVGFTGTQVGQLARSRYNKPIEELTESEVDELLEEALLISRSNHISRDDELITQGVSSVEESSEILRDDEIIPQGVALVTGIGIPDLSFLRRWWNNATTPEAKLIRQATKENTNIVGRGGSYLLRKFNRYFTSQGYEPRAVWEAGQTRLHNIRAKRTEVDGLAKRLQNFMDETVNEAINTGDKELVKNVFEALRENLSELSTEDHVKALAEKYKFSEEIAIEVVDARNMIDNLSKEILNSNIGSGATRTAIEENLYFYTNRSYRAFEEKDFVPSPKRVREAEQFFMDRWLAAEHNIDLDELTEGITWEDLGLSLKQIEEGEAFGKREVIEFLAELTDEKDFNSFVSKTMTANTGILKSRQDIAEPIQNLLERIENPPLTIVHTVNKMIDLIETSKYYNRVLELGGSVPSNKALYDDALNTARDELKNTDLTLLEELTEVKHIIPEGEFVNVRSGVTGDFTVGKVIKSSDDGYRIEIKDFNTQETTERFVPKSRVKANKNTIDFDLELIPRSKVVRKVADKIYEAKFIGTNAKPYTTPTYIFDKTQGDASIFNAKINLPGTPLHEKWTTKEFAQSLHGLEEYAFLSARIKNSPAFHSWRKVKGVSQSFKTVWDLTTQLRNNLGGIQFSINNGIVPFRGGSENAKILWNQMISVPEKDFVRQYTRLQELGVVNTSAFGGEWQALMREMNEVSSVGDTFAVEEIFEKFIRKVKDPIWKGKPSDFDSVKAKWYQWPQKMYMAVDDFYKMNAYAYELDTLKKVPANKNKPLAQLEEEAAEVVKDTFPNYDVISKGLKSLRDLPVGNFVAFTPEMIRTQGNILKQIFKEIKTPGLRKRGMQRLAGGAIYHTGWAGIGAAGIGSAAWMLDWGEEKLDALNTMTETPWSDRHNRIPIMINGKIGFIDPRFINPSDVFHGVYQDVLTSIDKGEFEGLDTDQIVADATWTSLTEMLSFATDRAMVADVMVDLTTAYENTSGRRGDGKLIYKSKDPDDLVLGTLGYITDTLIPGVTLDGKKLLWDLPRGATDPKTGRELDWEFVILEMMTGINIKAFDPEKSLIFSSEEYHDTKGFRVGAATMRENEHPEEWADRLIEQHSKTYIATSEMHRQIEAAKILIGESRVITILEEETSLNSSEIEQVVGNKYTPVSITSAKERQFRKFYGDHVDSEQILTDMLAYIKDISQIPLQPRRGQEGLDALQIKRLREGVGTGPFSIFPARNYDDYRARREVNLDFAKGGTVTKENPVPNAPKEPDERIDKMTGLPYDKQFEEPEDLLSLLGFGRESKVLGGVTSILKGVAKRGATKAIKTTDDIPVPIKAINKTQSNEESELAARALADERSRVSGEKIAAPPLNIGTDESLIGGSKLKVYSTKDIEELESLVGTAKAGTEDANKLIMAPVKEGARTGVRLNLNSSFDKTLYPELAEKMGDKAFKLQTIHDKTYSGKALSYAPHVTLTDAVFSVNQKGRADIAAGIKKLEVPEAKTKNPAMSVDGNYTTMRNVLREMDDDVVEIGMNPGFQHLFINLKTGQAVQSADIATVFGDRVYAKGVKYWKKAEAPEPLETSAGDKLESSVRYLHRKGGRVTKNSGGKILSRLKSTFTNTFISDEAQLELGLKPKESLSDYIYSNLKAAGYENVELDYGGESDAGRHFAAGILAKKSKMPEVSLTLLNTKENTLDSLLDTKMHTKMDKENNNRGFSYDKPIQSREDFITALETMKKDLRVLTPEEQRMY